MNAFIAVIPLFVVRFWIMGRINSDSLKRAAHFPKTVKNYKSIYYLYQLSNGILILYPLILKINMKMFETIIYVLGVFILLVAVINFAQPSKSAFKMNGIYSYSRNPMYIGYYVFFLGVVLLTKSYIMLIALTMFIIVSHWVILHEETWCIETYGEEYLNYMKRVRRYI